MQRFLNKTPSGAGCFNRRIAYRRCYSLAVFTHHETISADAETAVRMTTALSNPSTLEMSNQCLHIRMTLASITSVQKAKSQDARLLWLLKILVFKAARAFLAVIALDPCNSTILQLARSWDRPVIHAGKHLSCLSATRFGPGSEADCRGPDPIASQICVNRSRLIELAQTIQSRISLK